MSVQDLFGGVSDVLKQVGTYSKDVMGSINDIKNIFDPPETNVTTAPASVPPTQAQPASNPNLALADFAFQPNYSLFIAGAALLGVALLLRK